MTPLSRRSALLGSAGVAIAGVFFAPLRVLAADGKTLRIGMAAEAGDLDLLQNVSALDVYTLVFDPLVRYGDGGKLLPALAESWTVSPDSKILTFQLRPGVSFSDGAPFDAKAAEWNLARWLGKEDFSWLGISKSFDKLVVDGTHTIRIELKSPEPAALLELTIIRPVRFLSPKAADASGKQTVPIGTGAWTIVGNDTTQTVLARNEGYWGPKPAFDRLELKVVPDELARANALQAGDLDVIGGDWVAPLSPRRARTLQRTTGVKVFNEPGTATLLLGFNGEGPILSDPKVRRAISLGIDRASIAKVLYEGYADPTADLFPAAVPLSGKRHAVPSRDPVAAGKLLDEAGWIGASGPRQKHGKPLTLELISSDDELPGSRRLSELIQGQLAEVGITVTVATLDGATLHDRRPALKYDLCFFTTYAAPYDPHGSLAALFVSSTDSGPDGKIFVSKELDPVIAAALSATGDDRATKLQAVYDWLDAQAAICPLVAPRRLWAHGARVKSFALPPTEYDMPFESIAL